MKGKGWLPPTPAQMKKRARQSLRNERTAFAAAMANSNCRDAFYSISDIAYAAERAKYTDTVADLRKRRAFANKCLVRGDRKRSDEILRGAREDRKRGDVLYKAFKQAASDPNPNRCQLAFDVLMEAREHQGKTARSRSGRAAHPDDADLGLFANACVLRTPRALPTPPRPERRPIEMDGARRRKRRGRR